MGIRKFFVVSIFLTLPFLVSTHLLAFTQVFVFGDSLSDDGNIAHRVRDTVGFSYPSSNFNYSNYRFTDDTYTSPAANLYTGTWHEQLAKTFLGLPVATNSLDGGTDYAFGGATTQDGTQQRTVINNPLPFSGGNVSIVIDNIGKQVDDYLATHVADPNALYVIWGGGNDLFDNDSAQNVINTATRVGLLVQRLAIAGARNFLVPNLPPLGAVPNSFGDPNRVASLDLASADYRNQLNSIVATTIHNLAVHGITIHIYTLDVWLDVIRVLGQPAKYNFINTTTPAQDASGVNPDTYLFWDDIHPTTAGHHELATQANRLLRGQVAPLAKTINISTRGLTGMGEDVLIGGFIVSGTAPKKVIVRALSPSLAAFGVTGTLADTTLLLLDSNNNTVASNDNWKDTQQNEIQATGLAPPNYFESAVVVSLVPGSYTALVRGKNGGNGIALVDVYDLDTAADSVLENVSTRALVGTGNDVLIGGLVIGTGEPPVVVVRALGPSLSNFGIGQPLQDPTLELRDANGGLISANDNWKDNTPTAVKATLLAPNDDREPAIVASLAAGNYTAVVRGKNGTIGVGLIEAYRLQ